VGLRLRFRVVPVRQVGLKITNDGAELSRGEKPRPERAGRVLTDGRELSQGHSGRCGHMAKLPANLLGDSLRPIRDGKSSCLGGVGGRSQGVRAHMCNGRGLSCRSGGGHGGRTAHLASSALTGEAAPDLLRDVELTAGKGPCPRDGITGTTVARSLGLEESQDSLRAVRCPHRDDASVGFAQRLRRAHALSVPPRPAKRSRTAAVDWPRPANASLEAPVMAVRDQAVVGTGSRLLASALLVAVVSIVLVSSVGRLPRVIWTCRGFFCSGLGIWISSTPRSN